MIAAQISPLHITRSSHGSVDIGRDSVSQIESAFPGNEKFPANRGLAVVERDPQAASRSDFCGSQTSRAAADDGELGINVQGPETKKTGKDVNDWEDDWEDDPVVELAGDGLG